MELLHCPSISAYSYAAPKFANNSNNWANWSRKRLNSVNLGKNGRSSSVVVVNARGGDGCLEKGADTGVVVVEEQEKPPAKPRHFEVFDGCPLPFGATARDGGVNFAVCSANATSATLCLISLSDLPEKRVTEELSLSPITNRTGDVWHVFLKGDFQDMLYGYRFDGKLSPEEGHYFDSSRILVDPYAKAVISRGEYGALGLDDECWPPMACMVPSLTDEFDWEGDLPLKFPQRDLVVYEMHVRGFTRHESSRTEFPGTWYQLYRVNAMS